MIMHPVRAWKSAHYHRCYYSTSCTTKLMFTHLSLLLRSLCLHLTGGDASISQTHDRQRGYNLDWTLLRLVLRLCLRRLCPPLSHWHHTPDPVHAPDAQESMGDLHGRRARASRVIARQTDEYRIWEEWLCLLFWVQMLDVISRTRAGHKRITSWWQKLVWGLMDCSDDGRFTSLQLYNLNMGLLSEFWMFALSWMPTQSVNIAALFYTSIGMLESIAQIWPEA